jgi:hypothetical protein
MQKAQQTTKIKIVYRWFTHVIDSIKSTEKALTEVQDKIKVGRQIFGAFNQSTQCQI